MKNLIKLIRRIMDISRESFSDWKDEVSFEIRYFNKKPVSVPPNFSILTTRAALNLLQEKLLKLSTFDKLARRNYDEPASPQSTVKIRMPNTYVLRKEIGESEMEN